MLYICKECGGELKDIGADLLVCSTCGFSIDLEDYGEEDDYDDIYDEPTDKPEYCDICGGPWSNCMTSCKLFDD